MMTTTVDNHDKDVGYEDDEEEHKDDDDNGDDDDDDDNDDDDDELSLSKLELKRGP